MGLPETFPFGTAYHTHTALHTIPAELRELPTLNSFKNTTQNILEGLDSEAKAAFTRELWNGSLWIRSA